MTQIANRIKSKGLQKLRWYCQMCQKQCRDENGFKCHLTSESHKRQMQVFGEAPERGIAMTLVQKQRSVYKSLALKAALCCALSSRDSCADMISIRFTRALSMLCSHRRVL